MIKLSEEWLVDKDRTNTFSVLYHTNCRSSSPFSSGYVRSIFGIVQEIGIVESPTCEDCFTLAPKDILDKVKFIYASRKV